MRQLKLRGLDDFGRKLRFLVRISRDPLVALDALHSNDRTTMRMGWPFIRLCIVRDADLARALLIDCADAIPKASARGSRMERALTRDPLHRRLLDFPDDGGFWTDHRAAVTASFAADRLRRYSAHAATHAQEAARRWNEAGRIDDVMDAMSELAFAGLIRNLSGVDPPPDLFRTISGAFDEISLWTIARATQPFASGAWWPTRRNRHVRDALRLLNAALGELPPAGPDAAPIWNALQATESLNHRFQMMSLIIAGYETTASALCWAIMMLAEDPILQSDIRTESGMSAGATDGPQRASPLVARLLSDTMRLYPPLWSLGLRRVSRDLHVHGEYFRRGSGLWISPWLLHRMDGQAQGISLAFGAGPTACLGRGYATATMQATLTALVRWLHFDPPAPKVEARRRRALITLRPLDPVALTVRAA